MVGHSMKKAFKKLEAKTQRERRERSSKSKLEVIDPSHELSQQRKVGFSALIDRPCLHSTGLQSNPELHTAPSTWSSAASVYSFDSASISSLSTSLALDADLDDDLDMLSYDLQMRPTLSRRRSTGSSRAKSQQKLASILGWNTSSFPQWKPPTSSFSAENLKSPGCSPSGPNRQPSPTKWEENVTMDASSSDSMADLKMRQYPTRRANSLRDYSTKTSSQPYDFQMRQFLTARPYKDTENPRRKQKSDADLSCNIDPPRSATSARRNSNPNVHKPLPTTPAFPTFPPVSPLHDIPPMSSTSTPVSAQQDEFPQLLELSAEEASILLSQPEPSELSTDSASGRAELADQSTLFDASGAPTVRSKSPTQPRSASASSQVHDFGPGTTLSIIEEEPFDVEDLAKLKVFELPANNGLRLTEERLGSSSSHRTGDSCPGLSPSSSLSSKRIRIHEAETEAQLESQAEVTLGASHTTSDSLFETTNDSTTDHEAEPEGEEIFVGFDQRSSSYGTNMSGKSFLALDDDDDDEDLTDTEETYRSSIQSGESRFTAIPVRQYLQPNSAYESETAADEAHRRSTSADTTKTAYTTRTTSTANTLVGHDPDFSTDLAKRMDWL